MAFWNAASSQIKEASQLSLNFVFLLVPIFFLEFPIQLLNFSPLNSKTISLKLKFFSFATRSNLVANEKKIIALFNFTTFRSRVFNRNIVLKSLAIFTSNQNTSYNDIFIFFLIISNYCSSFYLK